MKALISNFPAEGSAEYAELVRRQDILCRSSDASREHREAMLAKGIGLHPVDDLPPTTRRAVASDGTILLPLSINCVDSPRPAKKRKFPWIF